MAPPSKNSPSLSSDADHYLQPKKQRGRPKGSKNKTTKSHPQLFSPNNPSLKDSIDVVHVPPGADVISRLSRYSCSRQKSITVLSASGLVSQLSVLPLLTYYPDIISVPGPVPVLSLSGSIPLEMTSSSPRAFNWLTICVPGCEGQIVYGLIGGSVVATSIVTIVLMATECESDKEEDNKIEFNNEMMVGNKPNAITISTTNEVEDYVVRPDFALESSLSISDYGWNLLFVFNIFNFKSRYLQFQII
ncbi:AT-hook motif nuclear-localized protein 17-like [Senna tora]|uniref:AT-hook motif nuclear-localized protein 17-like n=1 Tax=Senna tora TaxID=362788 RepID=A0A834T5V1_9FABA|nr:AT-hook motif nuclear-localized protein 17-like [Senna tora]